MIGAISLMHVGATAEVGVVSHNSGLLAYTSRFTHKVQNHRSDKRAKRDGVLGAFANHLLVSLKLNSILSSPILCMYKP
jgi:hypothetical protein